MESFCGGNRPLVFLPWFLRWFLLLFSMNLCYQIEICSWNAFDELMNLTDDLGIREAFVT